MKEVEKYTLGEAALGLIFSGFIMCGITLAVVPIDLALAWLRTQVWNWFLVPYLHAPVMNVWLMLALIFFVHMWRRSPRDLKKEMYERPYWQSLAWEYIADLVVFALCFGIHHWILKG